MITEKNKEARLDFFRALYENAKNAYGDILDGFDRNMRQYRGSAEIDGGKENAITVRNITYELIESQINSNIPQPKIDTEAYSDESAHLSESIEALLRAERNKLSFEEMNDLDERFTYVYGGSVWLCEWDNESGGVAISLICPKDFIPQPEVYSADAMEYCFIKSYSTRDEAIRTFHLPPDAADALDTDDGSLTDDGIVYINCFYKGENGAVGKYVFSGGVPLIDIENYYKRKTKVCKRCGKHENECACEGNFFHLTDIECEDIRDKVTGKTIPSVPFYIPSRLPIVVRRNTPKEKSLFGYSDCDFIRPEQQAINKIESRILQKLLRSGITPIVPDGATVSLNNSVFGQIIKMRPGESMAQYGTVDTTPDISADIAEAERLYDHAKRILGVTDAYQGISANYQESGYARQLKIAQSTGRLQSKKKLKEIAYTELDRLIFEHYLAFSDEVRPLSVKDGFGKIRNERFDRYDFLIFDTVRGMLRYNDSFLFGIDENGGSDYEREAIWERNLENLKAGTLGDPADPGTLLRSWQLQARAHYPHARENLEYFSEKVKEAESFGGL